MCLPSVVRHHILQRPNVLTLSCSSSPFAMTKCAYPQLFVITFCNDQMCLPATMITPPSTSLICSKNTTLLAFSDQHLDLSLMFPGPGIPRQSGTASEPSDMSLHPSGMSSPRASRRRLHSAFQIHAENPFLHLGMIVNAIVYVRLRWCVCV